MNCSRRLFLCLCALLPSFASADSLSALSQTFWDWRAYEQPFSTDDIPRVERPADFVVDWSPGVIVRRRSDLDDFEKRWRNLAPAKATSVREQVDYQLIGSAIARVRWELDIEQSHKRNPLFYVDQTLGSVYVLLLPPPPFSPQRKAQLVSRMRAIPATLQAAEGNLTDLREPFSGLAITALSDVRERCRVMTEALAPLLDPDTNHSLRSASETALNALEAYQAWLQQRLSSARKDIAIGRDNYIYFLRNVALMPFSPEALLAISKQEWSRTVAFESYEHLRDAQFPPESMFANQAQQAAREQADEVRIRQFLGAQHILSVPSFIKHYRNLPLPRYVEPFRDLGVTDDLTSASRLDEDGTSYIPKPVPDLGFFSLASAHDPRPIIVHEGVPGHYFQLCLSWAHPDPIRRHYYDSGANEGIGFYAEEMMLQAGLFDDSPHTREIIYSFMRLRALRVEVDVKLASGEFTLQQAAQYLQQTVPMDAGTALEEATLFATTPGQAISYQIGKTQIMALLADARRKEGSQFNLQQFHDFVWRNGNVPISLQRWELLGDARDVPTPLSFATAESQ